MIWRAGQNIAHRIVYSFFMLVNLQRWLLKMFPGLIWIRGSRLGAGAIGHEAGDEQRMGAEEGMIRGRCIPGRKRQPQQQK
jgi:hypothetical protein